jgi:hypothetical protein
MREFLKWSAGMALLAGSTFAVPLVPRIESHDFNFGGFEPASEDDDAAFYAPRGEGADWLTLLANETDREVTAFWEVWPAGIPVPVFNAAGNFGGDIELYLQFDGHDEMPPHLDVSLSGSGRRDGSDLNIFGRLTTTDGEEASGLLLSIDIEEAALYGFGNSSSFVLETSGKILQIHPALDNPNDTLVGDSAVSRGNIDFGELALKSGYDPLSRDNGQHDLFNDGGGYSGEVGAGFVTVPEPATLVLLVGGLMLGLRRK